MYIPRLPRPRILYLAFTLVLGLLLAPSAGILDGRAEAVPATGITIGEQRCLESGRVEVDFSWQSSGEGPQWLDFSFYNNGFAAGTFAGAGPLEAWQTSATYNLVAGTTHYLRINTLTAQGWQPSGTIYFTTAACGAAPPAAAASVALSFDDYAEPYRVHGILDVLRGHGVTAVFCITGDWAWANPGLVQRMRDEGHTLCNHTASHAILTHLSDEAIRAEIQGGVQSHLLRPPFGIYDARVTAIAQSMGYQMYLWGIDPRDWDGRSAQSIVDGVVGNLYPGAVILLHLHGPQTYDALPQLISAIRAQGYQLN